MTVAELIGHLEKFPGDLEVMTAIDAEGNGYNPLYYHPILSKWDEDSQMMGIVELTDELRASGYTEEDIPENGKIVVVL